MSTDWSMPRRADACAACQHLFEIGESFQAYLYEAAAFGATTDAGDGYARRDYCASCQAPEQPAPVAAWQTRRAAPATRKAPAFDREAIYALFERLGEAEETSGGDPALPPEEHAVLESPAVAAGEVVVPGARQTASQVQLRFILALLLWRKRVLKLERTLALDGHEVWEFSAARTGTVHRVPRPALEEAQLEQLSGQVEQLLAGQTGEWEHGAVREERADEAERADG